MFFVFVSLFGCLVYWLVGLVVFGCCFLNLFIVCPIVTEMARGPTECTKIAKKATPPPPSKKKKISGYGLQ